jgi:tetratricopeptide (TPR) repeat protein
MLALLLVLFADQFETTFQSGLIALNQGNLTLAEAQLQAASQIQPRNPGVWLALAQTYWKLHELPAAQAAAQNAESFGKDPALLHGLAVYYSETENFAKAAALEARCAISSPDAAPRAVALYLRAEEPSAAIEFALQALKAGDRADLHDLLGKAYEARGDPGRAIPEYQGAIRLNSLEESYYFDLAQLHLKRQDFAAALDTLQAGRKNFDKSAQLELAAGVAYYGLRRFPEAIDAFLHTIRLDPAVEQPYVFLGRMLDQAEDRLPAITAAFAALAKSAPGNYLGTFLYGKSLRLENPDRAEALLRESTSRNGKFWESHFELGVLLDEQGRSAEAASEFRRATELNPDDPAAHYRLARLYDKLGKTAEARAEREVHARLTASTAPGTAGIK